MYTGIHVAAPGLRGLQPLARIVLAIIGGQWATRRAGTVHRVLRRCRRLCGRGQGGRPQWGLGAGSCRTNRPVAREEEGGALQTEGRPAGAGRSRGVCGSEELADVVMSVMLK